jgi:hypothetical protein
MSRCGGLGINNFSISFWGKVRKAGSLRRKSRYAAPLRAEVHSGEEAIGGGLTGPRAYPCFMGGLDGERRKSGASPLVLPGFDDLPQVQAGQ